MPNPAIEHKVPLHMLVYIRAALEKEKEKYQKCPVLPDLAPGFVDASGWSYVVTGYVLVEQSYKALLRVREKEVPRGHSLSSLFSLLDDCDIEWLREFYVDYRETIGGIRGEFPFACIDDFLTNLDGDTNERGEHIGSFDWRYFLIEEKRSREMPTVSIDYLHEIVFGCTQILKFLSNGRYDPSEFTHSWRLREERKKVYDDWMSSRITSSEFDDLGDRVEILWGPDYKDRYDLLIFEDREITPRFESIPNDSGLEVKDKREEIEAFHA